MFTHKGNQKFPLFTSLSNSSKLVYEKEWWITIQKTDYIAWERRCRWIREEKINTLGLYASSRFIVVGNKIKYAIAETKISRAVELHHCYIISFSSAYSFLSRGKLTLNVSCETVERIRDGLRGGRPAKEHLTKCTRNISLRIEHIDLIVTTLTTFPTNTYISYDCVTHLEWIIGCWTHLSLTLSYKHLAENENEKKSQ